MLSAILHCVPGENFRQTLDIYTSQGAETTPVSVIIHGGGWNERDKDEVGLQPRLFNAAGIVEDSVKYRMVLAVRHPDNPRDVAAAIAWIHRSVSKFGGNPHRLYLMGHSTGWHLAALVATDNRYLAAHNRHRRDLAGGICLDGSAFDIPDRIHNGVGQVVGNCQTAFGEDESVQRDGSPVTHVAADDPLLPFLLLYLEEERLNHRQSRLFAELVRQSGGTTRLVHIAEDKTHPSLCDDVVAIHDSTGPLMVEFLLQREGWPVNRFVSTGHIPQWFRMGCCELEATPRKHRPIRRLCGLRAKKILFLSATAVSTRILGNDLEKCSR